MSYVLLFILGLLLGVILIPLIIYFRATHAGWDDSNIFNILRVMAHLIDKDALIAEIKKYIANYKAILNKVDKSSDNWVDSTVSLESKIEVLQIILSSLEPQDEKIRKALIRFHKSSKDIDGIKGEDILAWLEKQGQEKHLSEPIKDYQGSFGCWNNAHDFRPKHLQRCICYDKYMKGVYCYVYDDISKYWCTQTTEEHDPDGDNHICDYADYRVTVWMPLPNTSFYPSKSWLEKQGEKKPATLWHPADGDYLPETDRAVIVLTQKYPLEGNEYAVSFAHRPEESFIQYGKGGWSQPDVKWWLDCDLPTNKQENGSKKM